LRDSPAAPDDEHLAGADTVGVRLKSQPELHASVGQEFLHLSPSSVEPPPQGPYEKIVDTLGKRRPLKTAGDAAGKAAAPLVTPEASDWIASRSHDFSTGISKRKSATQAPLRSGGSRRTRVGHGIPTNIR
jgi:hypothetical protein